MRLPTTPDPHRPVPMNPVPLRMLRPLPLLLGLLLLSGCKTTQVLPIAPIPLSDPVEIEIDGERVQLHHPYLDEGDLVGWQRHSRSDSTLVRVPYEQEFIGLDTTGSLLLGIGGLIVALILVVAV